MQNHKDKVLYQKEISAHRLVFIYWHPIISVPDKHEPLRIARPSILPWFLRNLENQIAFFWDLQNDTVLNCSGAISCIKPATEKKVKINLPRSSIIIIFYRIRLWYGIFYHNEQRNPGIPLDVILTLISSAWRGSADVRVRDTHGSEVLSSKIESRQRI